MNPFLLRQSNERLYQAILGVRLRGRDGGTMAEVRDALAFRRRARTATLTAAERRALDYAYLLRNAPDLLCTLHPL